MQTAEEWMQDLRDELGATSNSVVEPSIESLQARERDVRRQALLDAAKAECPDCQKGRELRKIKKWWMHGYWQKDPLWKQEEIGQGLSQCKAKLIHDLLAQLKAEAQDIPVRAIPGTSVGDTTTRLHAALAKRPTPPEPERMRPNIYDPKGGNKTC